MNRTNNILITRYLMNVWYIPLTIATLMEGVFHLEKQGFLDSNISFLPYLAVYLLKNFLSILLTSSFTVLFLWITLTFFIKIQRPKWVDKFLTIALGWLYFIFSLIILFTIIPEDYIESVISNFTLNLFLLLLFSYFVMVTSLPKEYLQEEINDIDHLVD